MNALWQDLSLGARVLLKRPGFTLIAALTLALGIGATTAMFSVVNGVLLQRLPYGDEARVVVLWQTNLKNGVEREETSPANFFDWRDRAQSLDIVSAAEPSAFTLMGSGEPETFRSWIVTAGFFDALNVSPLYGRTLLPEEYEPGKGQVMVIGYGLWQRRFGPRDLPRLNQVEMNLPALGFAVAVSLLTALIFGLAPAMQILRTDLQESLRAEGRTMTGGRRQQRLRNLLVVSEIALALALLVGAGLLMRSFIALLRVNPGFATERALALETLIGRNRNAEQRIALVEQTLAGVQSLPRVQAVGMTSALPFHDNQVLIPKSVKIEDRASAPGQDPTAYIISVTPGYLRALGAPLLRGRELNQFDKADAAPVALVNNSMAVRHWPMEDPTGKKISFAVSGRAVTCEIVGVVGGEVQNRWRAACRDLRNSGGKKR